MNNAQREANCNSQMCATSQADGSIAYERSLGVFWSGYLVTQMADTL